MATPAKIDLAAAGSAPPRKMRILCLHGYLQSAEIFRSKIGSLRKGLKRRADFFFVDAPYDASSSITDESCDVATAEASQGTTASGRTWWHWKDIEPSRPSTAAIYSGWEASQSTIQAAIDAHWPIDGLLGFSQGATAIALYLSEHDDHALNGSSHTQAKESVGVETDATKRPRWAVLVSAFMPRDEACAARIRTAAPIPISSLHVHGTSDALVSRTRSEDLWKNFEAKKRRVYEHSGGHMVPTCSGLWKEELVEFLDAQH